MYQFREATTLFGHVTYVAMGQNSKYIVIFIVFKLERSVPAGTSTYFHPRNRLELSVLPYEACMYQFPGAASFFWSLEFGCAGSKC